MDIDELVPAGGGSLRERRVIHAGQQVATFSAPPAPQPDELWEHGTRMADATRDGSQGSPRAYRPGHGLEHEPEDKPERASFDLVKTAADVRSALRP